MILLFGVDGEGSTLVSLDDATLAQDRGADFIASVTPEPWNLNGGMQGHLRRFVQNLTATGLVAGSITPETDGVTGTPQSFTDTKQWEASQDEEGERSTVTVAVTSHTGTVELGESTSVNVPKRSVAS